MLFEYHGNEEGQKEVYNSAFYDNTEKETNRQR